MGLTLKPEDALTSLEAAQRLGIEPEDVYRLLFNGLLDGGPDRTGKVRFTEEAIADYLARGAPPGRPLPGEKDYVSSPESPGPAA